MPAKSSLKDVSDVQQSVGAANLVPLIRAHAVPIENAEVAAASGLVPCFEDSYPKPVDSAAFHGLAGEVVRLIEPHTEADPVALLVQLLVGFGNIIGRQSFISVEAVRHHLNLFIALVGETSKGRKGTSWNQVANIFERVDEKWRSDCVTNGLSSGEGLIWHVRDPISETKPVKEKGRHTGEYEVVIADPGITDKRLFVLEGEFANTLKVMERETNTLSPIIRQAWDYGNLKTLVKNSPARSTGAHISIVGHITREELRRLLNATEAVNGFANRFCWLAVRRSKCLPEGGQIHTVNFCSVVKRLKAAAEFSADSGMLVRSAATKALWEADYPVLSEGKPGLLGAVTGRSEAQVMRLSAIYALLDCSSEIQPQHHHAAMALWEYCERSAQWIFGTSTGDKNADRIEEALRHAGKAGLTRTEISENVFRRNLSAHQISHALELLEKSGQARAIREMTAGAPAERWYSKTARKEINELNE
jgi:hypothetical protein